MAYFIFNVPSTSFPNEFTKISDTVFCFPSKHRNTNTDYDMHSYCICIVISFDSEISVLKKLKDFIIILNLFRQEHEAIRWFSGIDIKKQIFIKDSIENIYAENRAEEQIGFYHDDFEDMPIHIISYPHPRVSFIKAYNNLINIPESDFLYKSLCYLAIIHPIQMFINKVYNNALFQNAMLFQLFESIMKAYDSTPITEDKKCPTCRRAITKGTKQRIGNFLSQFEFKDDDTKAIFINSAKTLVKSRNAFFHSLEGKTISEYYIEMESLIGLDKTIYLKEDMKHGYGVFNAVHNIKTINTMILLEKLLNYSNL